MGSQDFVNSYEGSVGKVIVQGMRTDKTAQQTTLGTCRSLAAGREIVYAGVGAAAISAAHVVQGIAPIANHMACAVAATASIGAKVVNVTLGATAVAKDKYQDGFLAVVSGTGKGYSYMVDYHLSAALSTALNIYIKDGLEKALSDSSVVTLLANKYAKCIVAPVDGPTAPVIGVSLCTASANSFVWLAKKGVFPVEVGSSGFTAGMPVICGCAAGTCIGLGGESAVDTENLKPVIGVAAMSAADSGTGVCAMVDLDL